MSAFDDFFRAVRAHLCEQQERRSRRLARKIPPRKPRKPPEAGIPVPAIPPRGPLPKQGGAEAPLEFDRD